MTETTAGRVVVLDVVGLQPRHLGRGETPALTDLLADGTTAPLRPPFPALTVPAQTTLATGQSPGTHGDVSSGEYDRDADAVEFWGRERGGRDRLWETASDDAGLTTGALFFQHLVGTTADVAVTPSPIEDENDDIVELHCWTNPDGFYEDLRKTYDHFPLHHYWGPGANEASSRWILDAARESIERFDPDLLWIYVPHLDYAGLRSGPASADFRSSLADVDDLLGGFLDGLRGGDRWAETVVAVASEYGFHAVDGAVFPNRALREAGLLETDDSGDVALERSAAFAMVDHQVAHVYVEDDRRSNALAALDSLAGVDAVLDAEGKRERGIDHPNAGEFVLVAEPDAWFQYYWWTDRGDAPPYATDLDIHAKPGFDPCEIYPGEDGTVSLDPSLVGGSHGRVDEGTRGVFGLGGPAAPSLALDEVDARAVAPTVADLLGVREEVQGRFEVDSVTVR